VREARHKISPADQPHRHKSVWLKNYI